MIPIALQVLKRKLNEKNFRKVRKVLCNFLDKLKTIENTKYHDFFTNHLFKVYYDQLGELQYEPNAEFDQERIVSFTRNVLKSFKQSGVRKEFFTYLTVNESKPQLTNTNKKYPYLK